MLNYEYLPASDGTGEAVLANIEANRLVGSITLEVDNVENWAQKFICTTGTVDANGYILPDTMSQFYGHLDAGKIIIDGFLPGYTDVGNTKDQKALIKQTTSWSDLIAKYVKELVEDMTPAGTVAPFAARVIPAGWLLCDGQTVSRTAYEKLFKALNPVVGTFTVTVASPGVFTLNDHGFETTDGVYLTTNGALPTGLAQNTQYFVIKVNANTFRLATTSARAESGTAINTTGVQSGIHTIHACPYGVGDGINTFHLPDYRGRVLVGRDPSQTEFNTLGKSVGSKTVKLVPENYSEKVWMADKLPSQSLQVNTSVNPATNYGFKLHNPGQNAPVSILQPSSALNHIIKT